MKVLKEWFMDVPWGKMALISWGNPHGDPVLLVHGYQDSVATFVPLLERLPDDFHYVGMDLPGHGKSEEFPTGLMLCRINYVTAIDEVVKYLEWEKFIYLAHSAGGETGLFYNAIRPNKISKFIFIDVSVSFMTVQYKPLSELYQSYLEYFDNYNSLNNDDRVYSKRRALDSVMKARGLTEEQAEIVLSRNLIEIGEDMYRISWSKRLKYYSKLNMPTGDTFKILTKNIPPTLYITASESIKSHEKYEIVNFIQEVKRKIKKLEVRIVEGGHDVHLTNPERLADDVGAFLKKEFVASKL